jgi:hypothetical protein
MFLSGWANTILERLSSDGISSLGLLTFPWCGHILLARISSVNQPDVPQSSTIVAVHRITELAHINCFVDDHVPVREVLRRPLECLGRGKKASSAEKETREIA